MNLNLEIQTHKYINNNNNSNNNNNKSNSKKNVDGHRTRKL